VSQFDDRMKREAEELGLGATGEFPHGKSGEHDEGGLNAALTTLGGKLVLNFGKSVAWVAMTKAEALALGRLLIERASALPG
jgi:hypothetical protein